MDEILCEKISDALSDVLDFKGTIICHNGEYIDVDEDYPEVSVKAKEFDKYMVAYVITRMFSEGKIEFIGDCDKDINYIKKLLGVENESK